MEKIPNKEDILSNIKPEKKAVLLNKKVYDEILPLYFMLITLISKPNLQLQN